LTNYHIKEKTPPNGENGDVFKVTNQLITFNTTDNTVSVKMGKDRVDDHLRNGAEYITAADDPGFGFFTSTGQDGAF
jgi:hypothetical protein